MHHEKAKYINHLGEELVFGEGGLFLDESELRNYEWTYTMSGGTIKAFSRSDKAKTLNVTVCSPEDASRLYEITEKDVHAKRKGALWVGDYQYRCYIVSSGKRAYINYAGSADIALSAVTDTPYWVSERLIPFRPAESQSGHKYGYKYPFRYTDYAVSASVSVDSLGGAPFKLIFYGPCENPEVSIGANKYKINYTAAQGQYITLTAFFKEREVTFTAQDGAISSIFDYRDKTAGVFTPIPPGVSVISWSGDFAFDLVYYDVRSEPPWI